MFIKTFAACAAFSGLFLATSAFGQKSTIAGNALGADSRPLKNAEVRIQLENAKTPAVTAKMDAKGHFVATNLPAGNYGVMLLVGGKLAAPAAHVKTRENQTVRLNLGGKQMATTVASNPVPKKRAVYQQPVTGSHMFGGGYPNDKSDTKDTRESVDSVSGAQLDRMQNRINTQANQ